MSVRIRSVLALSVWAAPCAVLGQDSRDETIQKFTRMEALEREAATLKQASAAAGTPAEPATAKETMVAAEPSEPEHSYADGGFLRNEGGQSDRRFALGEVDLFATARISPNPDVFETDNQLEVASVPVGVERLPLQYRGNDYFKLDIGSSRTAIGFYSTADLRGSWLQTVIARPKPFTFEDDGGFLPLRNVGRSANGKLPSGDLGLHYVVEVRSSRNYAQPGRTGFEIEQNAVINVVLYARPRAVPGLQMGFSSYHDRFSPLPESTLARSVWTRHIVYWANRFEFLNEGVLARFNEPSLGCGTVPGSYSQLGYRLASNWTPFFRFDYLSDYGQGQVGAYAPQYVPWRTVWSGGPRYGLTGAVALKLGREADRDQQAFIRAALQVAFTF